MGDEPLYTYKSGNDWVTVTANEFLADVRAVAKGLIHYGLKKGDAVAFMCRTSYDWDLTDAAIMACGGVLATIYDTDSAEQIRNIVNNSDARLPIVQDTDMRKKADGAVEEVPVPGAHHHHRDRWLGRDQGLRHHGLGRGAGRAHRFGQEDRPAFHRVHLRFHGRASRWPGDDPLASSRGSDRRSTSARLYMPDLLHDK